MNEHENWVRCHAIDSAIRMNKKNCGVDKIIDDASKISGFVLAKPATLTAIKHSVKS